MRLGKRSRRRGALDKALSFAHARAARLAAGPPLSRLAPAPQPLPAHLSRVASLAGPAAQWRAAELAVRPPHDLLVVHAEGRFLGGSYELCERARGAFSGPIVVSDVLIADEQLARAHRAGADAIAPIVVACERAGVSLAALAARARALGLACLPEVATLEQLELARSLSLDRVLVSLRDRDTLRACVEEVAPLFAREGVFVIGLFADTLPAEDARRAAELATDERATLAGETSLQTLA